ncbi:hypothetical protein MMC17_003021 [Xylographa soralifera]|nr:hypothetical protein [Xylographa soralifera]
MVHNHRVTDDFITVYSQVFLWHYFNKEPPGGMTCGMRMVAKCFWPQQYPTGEEPSAFLTGDQDKVPLLKRGTTIVPTYLEFQSPFSLIFEPSDEEPPHPLEYVPSPKGAMRHGGGRAEQAGPAQRPALHEGNRGLAQGFASGGRQIAQAGPAHQTSQPINAGSHHEAQQPVREGYDREGQQAPLPPRGKQLETQTPKGGVRFEVQTPKGGKLTGNWQLAHHEAQQPARRGYGHDGGQTARAPQGGNPIGNWQLGYHEAQQPARGGYGHDGRQTLRTPQGVHQFGTWQPLRGNQDHRGRQEQPAHPGHQHGRRPGPPSNPHVARQQPAEAQPRAPPAPSMPAQLEPHDGHWGLKRRSSNAPAKTGDEPTRHVPLPSGHHPRLPAPAPEQESSERSEETQKKRKGDTREGATAQADGVPTEEAEQRPAEPSKEACSSCSLRAKRPTALDFWR